MSRATARPSPTRPRRHRRRTTAPPSPLVQNLGRFVRSMWIVTALDLRSASRRRDTWIAVAGWLALIYGLLVLALAGTSGGSSDDGAGTLLHSLIATTALTAGLAIVPALGAHTLSRNRDSGLLDMLRVTQLSARAISWGVFTGTLVRVLLLELLTAPALLTALALGGTDLSGFVMALLVPGVALAAAAAVAQAVSARFARRATAVIAAYAATGVLALGPWVAYAAALPLTTEKATMQVRVLTGTHGTSRTPDGAPCTTITEDRERTRPDHIWWLLAPQPYVALADAAPGRIGGALGFDPLSAARDALRLARIAPPAAGETIVDECPVAGAGTEPGSGAGDAAEAGDSAAVGDSAVAENAGASGGTDPGDAANAGAPATGEDVTRAAIEAVPPTWPIGLAVLSLTGAASIAYSTRRLRAPGVSATGEHLVDSVPSDT